MNRQIYISVVACGLMVGGCDEGPGDEQHAGVVYDNTQISDDVTFRFVADNGEELNGVALNGIALNGIALNGIALNGIALNGIALNGIALNGSTFGGGTFLSGGAMTKLTVSRSKLEIVDDNNNVFRGNSLAGMQIQLMQGSTPVTMRIESVFSDANDPDINYTKVSVKNTDGTWSTMCRDGYGVPTEAIVIEGAYDNNGNFLADNGALAFACRGTASAKCIVWGYKPWEQVNGVSLRNHYQACLAMVRGDYCRTNTPHTVNGTAIDISDNPAALGGTRIQSSGTSWQVEAQWGVNGAVCFNAPRKLIYSRDSINPCYGTVPTCPTDKNTWRAGALLMTQATPG